MDSALTGTLSGLRPSPTQTCLLRACLFREPARAPWDECGRCIPDLGELLRDGTSDLRRLAPLLFQSMRRLGPSPDSRLLTVLRTAYLREELRSQEYRRITREVISLLDASSVPFLLFRGALLSEMYNPKPCSGTATTSTFWYERGPSEGDRRPGGRRPDARPGTVGADAVTLDHSSGLPVLRLGTPFACPTIGQTGSDLWSRAPALKVAGGGVRGFSAVDCLVYACWQALHCPRLESLRLGVRRLLCPAADSGARLGPVPGGGRRNRTGAR